MLKELMHEKLNEARKMKNDLCRGAYEAVVVSILNAEKSGKYKSPLTDEDIINIIQKEVKKFKESQSFYKIEDPHYSELQEKINILTKYLPKELSLEEVNKIVEDVVSSEFLVNGSHINNGKVIGLVVKQVGNRFDKSKIADIVKNYLAGDSKWN